MKPVGPRYDLLTEKLAIDCEMMPSNIGQLLGRVSVVNYERETVFDAFVCYSMPIIIEDTKEEYSGISLDDIEAENGALSFPSVQAHLVELLRDRIVVGHDIEKDLTAISMDLSSKIQLFQRSALRLPPSAAITFHTTTRDVQKCRRYLHFANRGSHHGPTLKRLAEEVLGRRIKQGRVSSVEDAVATMDLYRTAEADIEQEQGMARPLDY